MAADNQGRLKVLVITGMSGAGKTSVASALEDIGYFCVDNLPPALFVKFAESLLLSQGNRRTALVADVRGGEFFADLLDSLAELRKLADVQVIFLETEDAVLVRRYKETRRKHPLAAECGGVADCIKRERQRLAPIKKIADVIIDTSGMSARRLSQEIVDSYGSSEGEMSLTIISFGYKYGLPLDADLVFDVRFLPNPFYVPELSNHTGADKAVSDFVLRNEVAKEALDKFFSLVEFLLPYYIKESKRHLTVAIGCTGGRHRSVAIAHALAAKLEKSGYRLSMIDRDIRKADIEE
ncbi:MAG: RNase adapter RapZ [Clostridia bacterium]|nr:RNase adapter RapZ [Clostridia bacterium]MDD4798452.1 RNase adapter RapZ [Clostridia bacterium]